MRQADRALCLIDVLAAGAARTKGIYCALAQQVFVRIRQQDHVRLADGIGLPTLTKREFEYAERKVKILYHRIANRGRGCPMRITRHPLLFAAGRNKPGSDNDYSRATWSPRRSGRHGYVDWRHRWNHDPRHLDIHFRNLDLRNDDAASADRSRSDQLSFGILLRSECDCARAVIANDGQRYGSGRFLVNRPDNVARGCDLLTINGGNHVAGLQTCLCSRTVLVYRSY